MKIVQSEHLPRDKWVLMREWWDKRARREIATEGTVVFASGDWTQEPARFNAPDLDE